ncbi:MAG: Fic family protein [Alcanivoracaceae bacterium]|nr:Fic family protein [Alcanivoracaceae bacterium]
MNHDSQWIWQDENYPYFQYEMGNLEPILLEIKYYQGLLNGIYLGLNQDNKLQSKLDVLFYEAMETSAIEGEILSRDSVRSSLLKKLDVRSEDKDSSNVHTDGLVDLLLDVSRNNHKPLTLNRLFGWHNSLFPTGFSGLHKINVASFRGMEPMQIVSGAIGREKVHYIAPAHEQLNGEMEKFINYVNDNKNLSIIKAGIAHSWFVIIHPLDDGNGRIARAITDMLLTRESKLNYMLYSLSNAIMADKKSYYKILEQTTKGDIDISIWLNWFLNTILSAQKTARDNINHVLEKTRFWDRHKSTVLNARQIKVLERLLNTGKGKFTGGINTRKYASLAKTSKPTASRELRDLVEKGCLQQRTGTAGRNVSYDLSLPLP